MTDFSKILEKAKELEKKHHYYEENAWKNEAKRRKVSVKTAPGQRGKEKFKCNICKTNFGHKAT